MRGLGAEHQFSEGQLEQCLGFLGSPATRGITMLSHAHFSANTPVMGS
jgi:hypothetical protein